jgi:tetratricopeptide (TPR) repeat protein
MARRAPSTSPNTSQRERQAKERWWKTPTVIAVVMAALAAISVPLIYQRVALKPKSSDPTTINQQTHGPNSPTFGHVRGSVNINFPGISAERFQSLAAELGVTDAALESFFTILEQQHVPRQNLDSKLRDIAKHYKDLQEQLRAFTSDDPAVVALKQAASQALEAGNFAQVETLLKEASQKDLEGARQFQKMATQRWLSAAASNAALGGLQEAQLRYAEATTYYRRAVELVESIPKGPEEILATYLNDWAKALWQAGDYANAEPRLQRALAIREQVLGPEHSDVAVSLNNLALLYHAHGRYAEAEPLYRRALAISEQALGPDHPDVATNLENYAALLRATNRIPEAGEREIRAKAIRAKNTAK